MALDRRKMQLVFSRVFWAIALSLAVLAVGLFLPGLYGFLTHESRVRYLPSDLVKEVMLMGAGGTLLLCAAISATLAQLFYPRQQTEEEL